MYQGSIVKSLIANPGVSVAESEGLGDGEVSVKVTFHRYTYGLQIHNDSVRITDMETGETKKLDGLGSTADEVAKVVLDTIYETWHAEDAPVPAEA